MFCAFKTFSDMPYSKEEELQTFQIKFHLRLDHKWKTTHWPHVLHCQCPPFHGHGWDEQLYMQVRRGARKNSEGAKLMPWNLLHRNSFLCTCTLNSLKGVSHACLRWRSPFCQNHRVQSLWTLAIKSGIESKLSAVPTNFPSRYVIILKVLRNNCPLESTLVSIQLLFCSSHWLAQDQEWETELGLWVTEVAYYNKQMLFLKLANHLDFLKNCFLGSFAPLMLWSR